MTFNPISHGLKSNLFPMGGGAKLPPLSVIFKILPNYLSPKAPFW